MTEKRKHPRHWSVNQVCLELMQHDWCSDDMLSLLAAHKIDGAALLELTESDLRHDFFVNVKQRADDLLSHIRSLAPDSFPPPARPAARESAADVTISNCTSEVPEDTPRRSEPDQAPGSTDGGASSLGWVPNADEDDDAVIRRLEDNLDGLYNKIRKETELMEEVRKAKAERNAPRSPGPPARGATRAETGSAREFDWDVGSSDEEGADWRLAEARDGWLWRVFREYRSVRHREHLTKERVGLVSAGEDPVAGKGGGAAEVAGAKWLAGGVYVVEDFDSLPAPAKVGGAVLSEREKRRAYKLAAKRRERVRQFGVWSEAAGDAVLLPGILEAAQRHTRLATLFGTWAAACCSSMAGAPPTTIPLVGVVLAMQRFFYWTTDYAHYTADALSTLVDARGGVAQDHFV
eukprot:gene16035-24554_t